MHSRAAHQSAEYVRTFADAGPETAQLGDEVGQLDWIAGFVRTSRGVQIEAWFTALMRCIGIDSKTHAVQCESMVRTRRTVRRVSGPQSLGRFAIGQFFWLNAGHSKPGYRDTAQLHDHRRLRAHESRVVMFNDCTSRVSTFGELTQNEPDVASIIEAHAACPPSSAFFIVDNGPYTFVFPTSEILRVCYAPTGMDLCEYLWPKRPRISFEDGRVTFDGYAYVRHPRKVYPFRIVRNARRAAHEINQLLPRACAYAHSHDGSLPILIRPPFVGRAAVEGDILLQRSGSREIVVFQSLLRIRPAHEHGERWRTAHHQHISMPFAPIIFGGSVGLSEVNTWWHKRSQLQRSEFDARHLLRMDYFDYDRWKKVLFSRSPST